MRAWTMLLGLALCGGACATPPAEPAPAAAPTPEAAPAESVHDLRAAPDRDGLIDRRFVDVVHAAAAAHGNWTRLGDWPKWAPTMCDVPPPPGPLVSRADADSPHGGKLYFLYAKDAAAYQAEPRPEQPVGQALVKRSHAADEVPESDASARDRSATATRDGRVYRLGAERERFVMVKLAPDTPGTDRGWVYGTVSASGVGITSAGRVPRCVACHVEAGPDRVFGAKAEGVLHADHGSPRASGPGR